MAAWIRRWACAAAIAALAPTSNTIAASGLTGTATVSPTTGYAAAKLVATYSFTPKSSCAAYHSQVSWSFGTTTNWATGPAPSSSGANCTSSTPPTAPPSGYPRGSYSVCGTDTSVTSTPACATYTIRAQAPSPAPSPRPIQQASPSPSHSPSPSPAPGAITRTPSPSSPGSASPHVDSGGTGAVKTADRAGRFAPWPWIGAALLVVVIAGAWRFRSWLMGVFENVEVLGRSGADLETELLHHETSPEGEPEASPSDLGANPEAQAISDDPQRPPVS